eukprot:2707707-Amphidinium_carterae.1
MDSPRLGARLAHAAVLRKLDYAKDAARGVSIIVRVMESERWVQTAIDEAPDKPMRILLPHPYKKDAAPDDGFYLTRGLHARTLRFLGHPLFKDLQNGSTN